MILGLHLICLYFFVKLLRPIVLLFRPPFKPLLMFIKAASNKALYLVMFFSDDLFRAVTLRSLLLRSLYIVSQSILRGSINPIFPFKFILVTSTMISKTLTSLTPNLHFC